MYRTFALICPLRALLLRAQSRAGAPAPLTGFPFTDEDLTYSINWPSGIKSG